MSAFPGAGGIPSVELRALAAKRSGTTGVIGKLTGLLHKWVVNRRDRWMLSHLTDDQLKDIGLTRGDVQHELVQPFWRPIDYQKLRNSRAS